MGLFGGMYGRFGAMKGPQGSEMWELPFPQVNELGLSKKECLGCEFLLAVHDFNKEALY